MVKNKKNNFFSGELAINPIKKIRGYFIKGVFVLTCCHAVPALSAEDNTQKIQFDLPSSDLASALNNFAEKTGLELSYPASMVADAKSKPLKGSYKVQEGLHELLQGTGLAYRLTGDNSVTLEKVAVAEPQSDTITLKEMTVTGKTEYDADNDPYNPDYNRTRASSATKTDTPIMETPMSVQVVPKALINDQGTVRLQDALKNISGVQSEFSFGSVYDAFVIRGFSSGIDINSALYRDGVRLTGYPAIAAGLERIEVLKGPASILFGRIEPGGLINLVTKKPLSNPYYSMQQQFGSYDLYRTSIDATGPIGKDDTLLYRLNVDYLNRNSFRDFASEDQIYIAPSLTWNITEKTKLDLAFEYRNQDLGNSSFDYGIPAIGNRPADIPLSRYLGNPDVQQFKRNNYIANVDLTHQFNQDLKVHYKGMYAREDWDYAVLFPFGGLNETTGNLKHGFAKHDKPGTHDTYFTSLDINGQFSFFGSKHNVLLGADYLQDNRESVFNQDFSPLLSVNIFNPVWTTKPIRRTQTTSIQSNEWHGIYLQDQITLFDKVHLLAGLRYDNAQAQSFSGKSDASKVNPRVGVLYRPWNWLSVYGSYVESIGMANGQAQDKTVFDPEEAGQYEAGVKTEFMEGRLTTTLAYFELTKKNILTPDPINPLVSQAVGEARSHGVELDVAGKVTDQLNLIGSYAYTDVEITRDNRGNQGHRLPNVAKNSGSLWAKYDLTPSFTIGTGVFAAGQREGDNANSFQLPGYARLDAMAAYHWKIGGSKLTAQVNVNNILDKDYYKGALGRTRITPAEPINALGTLRLEY